MKGLAGRWAVNGSAGAQRGFVESNSNSAGVSSRAGGVEKVNSPRPSSRGRTALCSSPAASFALPSTRGLAFMLSQALSIRSQPSGVLQRPRTDATRRSGARETRANYCMRCTEKGGRRT